MVSSEALEINFLQISSILDLQVLIVLVIHKLFSSVEREGSNLHITNHSNDEDGHENSSVNSEHFLGHIN